MLTIEKIWFLKVVCGYYALPEDARFYIMQKCIPFVQAVRESIKINEVYDRFFNKDKKLKMQSGVGGEYVSTLIVLLNDDSIILDTRINDDRVEKLVLMLGRVCSIKAIPVDRATYVLKKGLIINMIEAFDTLDSYLYLDMTMACVEMKPFLHNMAKRISSSPSQCLPLDMTHNRMRKFIYVGLEIGVTDDCLSVLLNVMARCGVDMYTYLKQSEYLTEAQALNFTLFQQKCKDIDIK